MLQFVKIDLFRDNKRLRFSILWHVNIITAEGNTGQVFTCKYSAEHLSSHICVYVFSRVRLVVTPWTVLARLLCPCNFLGKISGVCCHTLFRGSSQPRDPAGFSCLPCIGRRILYFCVTWEALSPIKLHQTM